MLGVTGFSLALTGCGNATETGLEKLIQSETGGDVKLDLNGDNGFSVQTEDGGMSIDEDGNFIITDADGQVVTGNADAEGGDFNVETEDGSFSTGMTDEIPDNWPSEVPRPDALTIVSVTSMDAPEGSTLQVTGTTGDIEGFIANYVAQLEASGFDSETPVEFTGDEVSWAAIFQGPYGIVLNVFPGEGEDISSVSVMVLPPS